MKKCKYCQTEIEEKAKICPNCRKKQGAPGCLVVFLVFLGIIVIGSVFSSDDNTNDTTNNSNNDSVISNSNNNGSTNSSSKSEKFSYTISDSYSNGFSYYIEGIVTNNRDKDYSYVQIEFICYDKDGNNLGTAIDNTNNLLGKQTWKYKAMGLFTDGSTVDYCDFREVTGW